MLKINISVTFKELVYRIWYPYAMIKFECFFFMLLFLFTRFSLICLILYIHNNEQDKSKKY